MQEVIWRCSMPVKVRGGGTEPHGEIIPDYTPTVFAMEETTYSADLCPDHRQALRDCLAPFVSVAEVTSSPSGKAVRRSMKGKKGGFTTKDVRVWMKDQGYDVADSGRLPNEVIEKYRAAHSN